MSEIADVIVVGSGPSGAQAAKRAIEEGLSVTLIDVGNDEPALAESIPPLPFSELRRTDPDQGKYFVGATFASEVDRNDRLGSHFTAPRAYITKDVERLLPIESSSFFPTQSLALGGLGVGWGAGCQTYEPFELERAGMPPGELPHYYDEVAADIGISGGTEDDTAAQVLRANGVQPPSDIDTNARSVLAAYTRRRSELRSMGFNLGRDPLALLTSPLHRPGIDREANPYTDMDYYGTSRYSVYRPKYTILELLQHPKFRYVSGALVERFDESDAGVRVSFCKVASGARESLTAKKLLLAAGALNSARIALRSRALYDVKLPLLSNTMHYMPCVNLRMLGRPADDRRHSLGQLLAVYTPEHRAPEHVILGMISYRSLLHYRIVRQMPLPPALGVLLSRTIMTGLTMVGVHHPEEPSSRKWMALQKRADGDALAAGYEMDDAEERAIARDLRGVSRCLRKIGCLPLATFTTNPGSSIHYAGTMPLDTANARSALSSDIRGKLNDTKHVFLADSAAWNYLPAKGLTFTLMANARRIAHMAACELRSEAR